MIKKTREKENAIEFRKRGFSYREILENIPVAKSTLSLWLRGVGLAREQKQRLTEKRKAGALRGAESKRLQRIEKVRAIRIKAKGEIEEISRNNLFLIGCALYWAEGTKEKEYRTGSKVCFNNSDPKMVLLFRKWLREICFVPEGELVYELYIHTTSDWNKEQKYWANILGLSIDRIRVYFKNNIIKTKRDNYRQNYHGLIRITVRRSTDLNRKIAGWIEKICDICNCGVV